MYRDFVDFVPAAEAELCFASDNAWLAYGRLDVACGEYQECSKSIDAILKPRSI